MAEWTRSGQGAAEFARRRGLSESSLRWWRWQLGSGPRRGSARAPTAPAASAVSPLTFVEMTAAVPSEMLEVVLVSGVRLRIPAGFDIAVIERVLDVLQRR